MLEKSTKIIAPGLISYDFIGYEEDYDYRKIFKAIIHVWIIPFILAFIDPLNTVVYWGCLTLLYSTVFRYKSDEFWGVSLFTILIALFLIVS